MNTSLERELETYKKHLVPLVREHAGRHVLISGDEVVSVWDTRRDALQVAYGKFGVNTPFLVKQIDINEPGALELYFSGGAEVCLSSAAH